nr:immunoglobulin light chain junction region [Macaca mulatta]
CLQTKNSPRTL